MKKLIALIFVLSIPTILFAQMGPPPGSHTDSEKPEIKVQSIKIINEYENTYYGARLEPVYTKTQTTPFNGTITKIFVREGSVVNKNSPLFSISRKTQATTGEYVPMTVYAFSSGIISTINIEENDEVSAGKEAISIADTSKLIAQIFVSDKDILSLSYGQKCYVVGSDSISGTIKRIAVLPDSSSGLFPIDVEFSKNKELFTGKFVSLRIPIKPLSGAYVPTNVIISRYGKKFIYTIQNNIAHMTEVTILKISDKQSLVSGLKDKDTIAISNMFLLAENKEVTIIEDNKEKE